MKVRALAILALFVSGCLAKTDTPEQEETIDKPKVSFTFDDGITNDILDYQFEDWNRMILTSLEKEGLTAAFFVTGSNKLDEKGKYLLESWSRAEHLIANHTFTHPSFNNEEVSVKDFEKELLQTDKVISSYDTYTKLFRFPYLKEGNTEEKINGFRQVLSQHGYQNGHVTIDASDWYVNNQLIKFLRKEDTDTVEVVKYKEYYLQHILERAHFYDSLAYQMTNRRISHTLLLHHNLTSALFLGDLIERFREEGWEIVDAQEAFQDDFFDHVPSTNPAGESLVWSMAKETGKYENILRYPAEDSRYEIPKMKKLGIQID